MIQPISKATASQSIQKEAPAEPKLTNPILYHTTMLRAFDRILADMCHAESTTAEMLRRARIDDEQNEIEKRHDYAANVHLMTAGWSFGLAIASAFANIRSENLGLLLKSLAEQGDRGAKFLLEPNQAGIARYQLLQQFDRDGISKSQQNAQQILQLFDRKKDLEKTLIELSAQSMRIQV